MTALTVKPLVRSPTAASVTATWKAWGTVGCSDSAFSGAPAMSRTLSCRVPGPPVVVETVVPLGLPLPVGDVASAGPATAIVAATARPAVTLTRLRISYLRGRSGDADQQHAERDDHSCQEQQLYCGEPGGCQRAVGMVMRRRLRAGDMGPRRGSNLWGRWLRGWLRIDGHRNDDAVVARQCEGSRAPQGVGHHLVTSACAERVLHS